MNANVFNPPKNPTPTHTINIKPDKIRIVDSSATSRKWDHPGVVGENESCEKQEMASTKLIRKYVCEDKFIKIEFL